MSLNARNVTHSCMQEIRDLIAQGYYLKVYGGTLWAVRTVS